MQICCKYKALLMGFKIYFIRKGSRLSLQVSINAYKAVWPWIIYIVDIGFWAKAKGWTWPSIFWYSYSFSLSLPLALFLFLTVLLCTIIKHFLSHWSQEVVCRLPYKCSMICDEWIVIMVFQSISLNTY